MKPLPPLEWYVLFVQTELKGGKAISGANLVWKHIFGGDAVRLLVVRGWVGGWSKTGEYVNTLRPVISNDDGMGNSLNGMIWVFNGILFAFSATAESDVWPPLFRPGRAASYAGCYQFGSQERMCKRREVVGAYGSSRRDGWKSFSESCSKS